MKRHGHFKLTIEEELQIIERYNNGESTRKIAETSILSKSAISALLRRHDVETKGTGNSYGYSNKKYTLNASYFSKIDTEEKAYWLGFISADGHVSDEAIEINIQKKDEQHLVKFLKAVDSNSVIKYQDNAVCIDIYSKQMVADLRKLGFMHNKSETQTFPDIPENLHVHFIRGLFDGDGSIKTRESLCFSGTAVTMKRVQQILIDQCSVSKTKPEMRSNTFTIIEWGGRKQFMRILDWMYQYATVYLDRKYKRYLELKGE